MKIEGLYKHPKLLRALRAYGRERFEAECERVLSSHPRVQVVLGLLGGASRGRYTAGEEYPRMAIRYERGVGVVGCGYHSGPYYCVAL